MKITEPTTKFAKQEVCIQHLERVRWPNGPVCPYCFSSNQIARDRKYRRHHCNTCNMSFRVTINTIFHDTKLPLQKWFLAIALFLNAQDGISAKQLQRDLKVTYKTAWFLAMRIRRAMLDQPKFLNDIVKIDKI